MMHLLLALQCRLQELVPRAAWDIIDTTHLKEAVANTYLRQNELQAKGRVSQQKQCLIGACRRVERRCQQSIDHRSACCACRKLAKHFMSLSRSCL